MTPEIYDPATGRFSPAGPLPAIESALLERMGVPADVRSSVVQATGIDGVLVASGGDALLVGSHWSGTAGAFVRTLRYSAATGHWTEVGEPYVEWCSGPTDDDGECPLTHAGVVHPDGIVAALPDGRILAAGGSGPDGLGTRDAELLDPTTGTWSTVGPMPGARVTAASLVTATGDMLIVGGFSNGGDGYPVGLGDAFLFEPGS